MQFIKSAIALTVLLSVASAAVVGEASSEVDVTKLKHDNDVRTGVTENLGSRAASPFDPLSKRACVRNGCRCARVRQGQYCGMCDAVLSAGGQGALYGTDIYECSPSGACCWYGPSSTCAGSIQNDRRYCPK